jgi:hypothetical protein
MDDYSSDEESIFRPTKAKKATDDRASRTLGTKTPGMDDYSSDDESIFRPTKAKKAVYQDYSSNLDSDMSGLDDDDIEAMGVKPAPASTSKQAAGIQRSISGDSKKKASTFSSSTKPPSNFLSLRPISQSKKPADNLLRSCFKCDDLEDGRMKITCLKCPREGARLPYSKIVVKSYNATHLRVHITQQCIGASTTLVIELERSKLPIHVRMILSSNQKPHSLFFLEYLASQAGRRETRLASVRAMSNTGTMASESISDILTDAISDRHTKRLK